MAVERKEQGSTRQSILQLLRRHSQMTALELSDSLDIGAVGIRQHLALLERDGLVQVVGLRRNVGRPSHLYALTAAAEAIFPKRYHDLALDVINYVAEINGPLAVEQLLSRRREDLFHALAPHLQGKSRAEQVAELAHQLLEQGYMCECEQLPDGSFVLTKYNCPVDCVARQHAQLCTQELKLYEDLLGTPIDRDSTIAQGSHCCCYRIPA
jgi:predicted ArsR family transcriptional regulator